MPKDTANTQPPSQERRQRLGAYAIILREDQILLCRLAPRITPDEWWTLPGGGVEFGEHPQDSLVREIHEETGLEGVVGDRAIVLHGRSNWSSVEQHAVRLVFDAWVPTDAPPPRVVEVDGSTVEARWHDLSEVYDGRVPVVAWVREALESHAPATHQRLAAYGVALRDDQVLLTRISDRGHQPGMWTLPGGGVDHGESPATSLTREFHEETGLSARVGDLLGVHDEHFSGTAPTGRHEDFHGVHLIFAVEVEPGEPRVVEDDGTTDAVAWVPVADVEDGRIEVFDVVREGLARARRR